MSLSSLLVPTLTRLGMQSQARMVQVMRAWTGAVGEAVAAETRVMEYRRGRIVVETSSPALSHQLHLQAQVIVDGLNSAIGDRVVNNIRFRLMPEAARLQKTPPRTRITRP